jgi:hypothetical protein
VETTSNFNSGRGSTGAFRHSSAHNSPASAIIEIRRLLQPFFPEIPIDRLEEMRLRKNGIANAPFANTIQMTCGRFLPSHPTEDVCTFKGVSAAASPYLVSISKDLPKRVLEYLAVCPEWKGTEAYDWDNDLLGFKTTRGWDPRPSQVYEALLGVYTTGACLQEIHNFLARLERLINIATEAYTKEPNSVFPIELQTQIATAFNRTVSVYSSNITNFTSFGLKLHQEIEFALVENCVLKSEGAYGDLEPRTMQARVEIDQPNFYRNWNRKNILKPSVDPNLREQYQFELSTFSRYRPKIDQNFDIVKKWLGQFENMSFNDVVSCILLSRGSPNSHSFKVLRVDLFKSIESERVAITQTAASVLQNCLKTSKDAALRHNSFTSRCGRVAQTVLGFLGMGIIGLLVSNGRSSNNIPPNIAFPKSQHRKTGIEGQGGSCQGGGG